MSDYGSESVTEVELARRIRRHNWFNVLAGIVLLLGSAPLWLITFFLLAFVFSLPWNFFGLGPALFIFGDYSQLPMPGFPTVATYVTMAFLAFDAAWRVAAACGWGEYDDATLHDLSLTTGRRTISYARFLSDRAGMMYIVFQLLTCAPRAMQAAVEFLRSPIRATPEAIGQAAIALNSLSRGQSWRPMDDYCEAHDGIRLLLTMKLAWLRSRHGKIEIRNYPAGDS